jgi:outer membrane protein OmpA-like peptidoglycan-associated protein
MKTFLKSAVAAAAIAGATVMVPGLAAARDDGVSVGVSGPVYTPDGAGYSPYDREYYYDPIYISGSWYHGPYRWQTKDGQTVYWVNNSWHRNEWREHTIPLSIVFINGGYYRDGRYNGFDDAERINVRFHSDHHYTRDERADLVGPPGATGPTGATGPQGPTGPKGAQGYALSGPPGEMGPPGQRGPQGYTGATGASGEVVVGARGATGAAGAAGAEGEAGAAGAQGASAAGPTGPTGPRGPAGEQGLAGETGLQGATLIGPTGRTGDTGSAGMQGESGQTGDQGRLIVGMAGNAGPSGAQGAQGASGFTGAQGAVGIVGHWTTYREFYFDREDVDLRDSERNRIAEIAAYLSQNPSLVVGIDSSMDDRGSYGGDRDLGGRRANAVRRALMQAGVPAENIRIGAFGDPDRRHDGQVQIMIETNGI